MRLSTLLYLLVLLSLLAFYFYYIEPILAEMWQRYLILTILLTLPTALKNKLELHFESLNRRINKELSVWIVIGLFSGIIIFGILS